MHRLVKSSRQAGQGQGSRRENHFFGVPAMWQRRYNRRVFTTIVSGDFRIAGRRGFPKWLVNIWI
jgi:hypothetical protein